VYASGSFVLTAGSEVEVLTAYDRTTSEAINLAGNELGQTIYGNNGANLLSGGGGADTLYGMGGNDAYYIDGTGDVVYEFAGGGYDTIYTTGSFSLSYSSEIELITVEDRSTTNAVNLLGNALGQTIYGNAGNNVLRGGGGTDSLYGFAGNDAYLVDDLTDQVTELAGQGTDTVYTTGHFALTAGSEIEVLSVYDRTTTNAINMAGNAFANTIYGNAGNNVIDGKAGADTIYLMGGTDTVYFSTPLAGGNVDALVGFASGDDKLQLNKVIFAGLAPGALPADAFVLNALPADGNDRLLYNQGTGQLFFDADGNGAGAAILFATLGAGTVLAASDFLVV
jgi:Ca2+-binding RTX toxin-like protein